MRILITGGAGYIGDAAVEYLLGRSMLVTVLDKLLYGGSYMRQHKNLSFVRGDIRDKERMAILVSRHDAVLHLAAIVGDGACQVSPKQTLEVNQDATAYIAALCAEQNKRMVFASTCSVYGSNDEELTEDSETNPLSIYAGTKLNAETHVRAVPQHYIFRLGTLFGISASHARLRCDLVANILTYRAMSGQKLKVFGGEQWRPLLHVKDAGELMAMATVRSTYSKQDAFGFGTYILSRKNYRMVDLAASILTICDLPLTQMEVTSMPFEDQRNYRVSAKRKGRVWLPRFHLHNGIEDMARVVEEGRIADLWSASHHNARYVKEIS